MSEIDAPGDPNGDAPDGHLTFDPPTEYRTTTLPDDLRPLVATAYGMDGEPVTLGDWIVGFHRRLRAMDTGPFGFDDLYHLDGGDQHVLRTGEERLAFHCVFDPLLVPFLDGGPDPPLTIESRLPDGGATITIEVDRDGVTVTPTDAVMSFGVARSLADEPDAGFDPARAYGQICAYGNAFPDRASYEDWAAETDEAATVVVPLRAAVGLARDLVVGPETRQG